MDRDEVLMAARLSMQIIGGVMLSRGIGDAATWEAAAGLAVIVAGFFLSRRSRRRLRARAQGAAPLPDPAFAREMVGQR